MLIDIFRKRAGREKRQQAKTKLQTKKPKITQIRGYNSFPASCCWLTSPTRLATIYQRVEFHIDSTMMPQQPAGLRRPQHAAF
jgi:hypothetical protein